MTPYETSATVEAHGQVRVAGVPFEAGTRVDVMISPAGNVARQAGLEAPGRSARLMAALDKARNVEPVGRFRRDEVYDRHRLH